MIWVFWFLDCRVKGVERVWRERWGRGNFVGFCVLDWVLFGRGGVRRMFFFCFRGGIGCGKIIKFLVYIEICYVFSIIVNREMVIFRRVFFGTVVFFCRYL